MKRYAQFFQMQFMADFHKILFIYFLSLNVLTFFTYGIDK